MNSFNLTAFAFLISIHLFAQPKPEQVADNTIIAQLQKDIPVLMKRSNVPGLSIALIRNGKLVWSKGFGVMNADNKRPVTNETVFECNSLSKPVFTYAVMRLVDESKLALDSPFIHYIDSSWHVSKDPRMEKVTLRMLLNQTSGIKRISQDEAGFNSSPGEKWEYQPFGFQLLGKVVEKITGMPIEDYMYKSILQPLGMTSSSFVWMPMYDSLRVSEHDWQGHVSGTFFKWQHAAACCSLESTSEDYAKFVIAAMEGKLLSSKSAAEMIQPQIKINEKFPSVTWGVGWGLEINGSEKSIWHWGHGENCKDYIEADLGKKNAVIFFANSDNGFFFTKEIIDDALRRVHFSTQFLDYQRYDSPSWLALQEILSKGSKSFLKSYKKFGLEEGQLNNISYQLMNSNRLKDALEIFKLNIQLFPNSWNAYDSYGEALLKKGSKDEAIKMYKKSLELNPGNENGKKELEKLLTIVLLQSYSIEKAPAAKPLRTGADQTEKYLPLLKGKRVAIMANPTSIIGKTHLVDSLQKLGVNIVKVFGPEHGFRGNVGAGVHVEDEVDPATHIPLISLYGGKNKPTKEDMANVDILIYDLQDVGVRYYTNINALVRLMDACVENGKEMLILDRPNPNAYLVDGPILDMKHRSGIGMFPIPMSHGLTVGEFAQMANGEGWLANKSKCKLSIIPVANYDHDMPYILPVKPSPNLNTQQAIMLYPSTCMFEATYLNHGRGTYFPFTVLGSPELKGIYSFSYTPTRIKGMSETSLFMDQECFGLDLRNYDVEKLRKSKQINIQWIIELYNAHPHKEKFFDTKLSKEMNSIEIQIGVSEFRQQVMNGVSEAEIRKSWEPGLSQYKEMRKKYLLYP